MNIPQKYIKLTKIDITDIKSFVNDLTEDDWNAWNYRQKSYNFHSKTKTYPLSWTEYVNDEELRVIIKNKFSPVWDYIENLIIDLESHYDGRCTSIMFANLLSKQKIPTHTDRYHLRSIHRCHLPIITNSEVQFIIDNESLFLEEGNLYEINNTLGHSVENNSKEDRIHLIIDILPSSSNINLKFTCE
jgi:hypothetical protein